MAQVDVHRVVVLGAGRVGKTSLITRFIKGAYDETHSPTLEDLHRYVFYSNEGKFFHMEILDTAGSLQFPAMRKLSIQSGHAFIIVYALDDNSSVQDAIDLSKLVMETKGRDDIPICLCGNKLDVCGVDKKRACEKGMWEGISMTSIMTLEASAKDDYNIGAVFESVFKALIAPEKNGYHKNTESLGARMIQRLSLALKDKRRSSEGDTIKVSDQVDNGKYVRRRLASCGSIPLFKKEKEEDDIWAPAVSKEECLKRTKSLGASMRRKLALVLKDKRRSSGEDMLDCISQQVKDCKDIPPRPTSFEKRRFSEGDSLNDLKCENFRSRIASSRSFKIKKKAGDGSRCRLLQK